MERRTTTLVCFVTLTITHTALAQNPTMSLIPLVDDVRRECVGGPNDGQVCTTTADCEVGPECQRVCEGGPNDGSTCSHTLDCLLPNLPASECVQQCYCNRVISAHPGDVLSTEFFIRDWSPNGQALKAFEFNIDMRSLADEVRPWGFNRPSQPVDCSFDECPEDYPICDPIINICQGPDHNPQLGFFIDETRTDYVFLGLSTIVGHDTVSLRYRYGAVSFSGEVTFTESRYAGSLILEIVSAVGERINIPITKARFLDSTNAFIVPADAESVTINVVEPVTQGGPIPTTSTWGIVALSLSLLAGARVYFGRKIAA